MKTKLIKKKKETSLSEDLIEAMKRTAKNIDEGKFTIHL
jgi:hypothetical protein